MSTFEIRRAADRPHTRTDWLDSAHSFAFGSYYDPDNLGFGALQAFNYDILQPGPGYPVHAHADVEILTWVVQGSLTHRDEAGDETVIPAGRLHHLSAGSGIRHTEASTSPDRPVQLVQMWLSTDQPGLPPVRQLLGPELPPGRLVLLASGTAAPGDPRVLRIRQRAAALSVARVPAGAIVALPVAPLGHLFLTAGSVRVHLPDGDPVAVLQAGDALRSSEGGAQVSAVEPAELLLWQLHAADAPTGAPQSRR